MIYRDHDEELRSFEELVDFAQECALEIFTHEELAEFQVNMECRNIKTDLGMTRDVGCRREAQYFWLAVFYDTLLYQ